MIVPQSATLSHAPYLKDIPYEYSIPLFSILYAVKKMLMGVLHLYHSERVPFVLVILVIKICKQPFDRSAEYLSADQKRLYGG
jgi:hypothetical protein